MPMNQMLDVKEMMEREGMKESIKRDVEWEKDWEKREEMRSEVRKEMGMHEDPMPQVASVKRKMK